MKILFLRHGETDTNVRQLTHKKGSGEGLNKTGLQQAHKLAKICRAHGVQNIYSSPELRAIQTAEIIGQDIGLEPIILEDLSERHWGDWDGLPWNEISSHLQPMSIKERYKFIPPNGESWEQMEQRLLKVVRTIHAQDKTAAVVTHAGALRALMPPLKKEPLNTSLSYDFQNASVTIFEGDKNNLAVRLENDTSHLS